MPATTAPTSPRSTLAGTRLTHNLLLASPECTNHSNAKGVSRKAQNPSLFDQGPRHRGREVSGDDVGRAFGSSSAHRYDAVVVENVVDAFHRLDLPPFVVADLEDAGYEACVVNPQQRPHRQRPTSGATGSTWSPSARA